MIASSSDSAVQSEQKGWICHILFGDKKRDYEGFFGVQQLIDVILSVCIVSYLNSDYVLSEDKFQGTTSRESFYLKSYRKIRNWPPTL